LLNVNLVAGKPVVEGIGVLEQFDRTTNSAVLTEKLGDLYSAQGKPASAIHAYQDALKLDPSPQQRVRLLLDLGEKLSSINREAEAYDAYQQLLREDPDYPDKTAIYKSLLPLAKKLGRKDDAQSYQAALNPPKGADSAPKSH
jgi:tetratricopeptide (TPR) repeat protein